MALSGLPRAGQMLDPAVCPDHRTITVRGEVFCPSCGCVDDAPLLSGTSSAPWAMPEEFTSQRRSEDRLWHDAASTREGDREPSHRHVGRRHQALIAQAAIRAELPSHVADLASRMCDRLRAQHLPVSKADALALLFIASRELDLPLLPGQFAERAGMEDEVHISRGGTMSTVLAKHVLLRRERRIRRRLGVRWKELPLTAKATEVCASLGLPRPFRERLISCIPSPGDRRWLGSDWLRVGSPTAMLGAIIEVLCETVGPHRDRAAIAHALGIGPFTIKAYLAPACKWVVFTPGPPRRPDPYAAKSSTGGPAGAGAAGVGLVPASGSSSRSAPAFSHRS